MKFSLKQLLETLFLFKLFGITERNLTSMKNIKDYRNIVFDMGDVLIEYESDLVTKHYTDDPEVIREIHNVMFCSQEWFKLDGGLITEEVAESRWLPRMSSDRVREIARLAFRDWHLYNMWEKPGMAEVVTALKNRGQHIYILSNASLRLPDCYREVMPRADLYDGVFFSAEEKCVKPQDVIFQRFFRRFDLKPEDCFFIDDLPENIAGAAAIGMDGYVFQDGKAETLRKVLEV